MSSINLNRYDALFIPKEFHASNYQLRRARVFVLINLIVLVLIAATFVLSLITVPPEGLRLGSATLFCTGGMFIFRRTGNLALCGNILACGFAQTIIPAIFVTGGIFSDNMVWLLVPSLVALLFSTIGWSFFWFSLSQAVVFYTFFQHPSPTNEALVPLLPINFMLSFTLFFASAMSIIWAFKIGQEDIIKDLQKSQRDLQDQKKELTEKTQELKKLGEQLQKSNNELSSFAYAASHDMKEPLRMIGMYTQLVKRRLAPAATDETTEFMGFVTDGVLRMQRLLDDLLEFAKVGRGGSEGRPVDLNDVVFLVKTNLKALILDTSAEIEAAPLPTVMGRSTELVQLFQNLLANAIKFRKADVRPKIQLDWERKNGEMILSIADNGIGIAPEYQEKVFAIFARLHSREEFEGSGIGLATCRKIAESMDGRIFLTSELGRGTTFFIALPMSRFVHPMLAEKDKIFVPTEIQV